MIEKVIEIVKNASQLLNTDDMEVIQKGNASNYVTSIDVSVQEYLQKKLQELLPDSSFIGEESKDNKAADGYVWIIDPIDGTSNFIRDIGISAISVGLWKDGKPYMGVLYQPYRDEMYYAQIGQGAYKNGKQIHVSDRDFSHSHLCAAMSLYEKKYATNCFKIIERIYHEADDLRRLGSAAAELAYLAAGRVELYFEIRVFPWDVAAAIPIILEAGGYVECMFSENMPLDRPFPFIAANSKENFERLKSIVYDEIPKQLY